MNSTLTKALKKHFGFDRFRPMQEEIITAVMAKKDCLVIMPTGGGKSICFQLPALLLPGTFIIISPLIALMKDQVESLRANNIEAAFINSALEFSEERRLMQMLTDGSLKLLYLSPEKLLTNSMLEALQGVDISGFAVDEAHCISVWGHDFRAEYSKLNLLKNKWPKVPIMALTATADKITRRDIVKQLAIENCEIFLGSFNRANLSLQVRPGQKVYKQVKTILERHNRESGIIYCLSRKSCEEVAAKLKSDGYKAAYYHAGMTAERRSGNQEDFVKDNIRIIVATIAFGMGIDKSNIRFIIHYNLPKNIEGYYQEIGRGGRDGLSCETVMFYSYRDVMILQDFAKESNQAEIQIAKLKRIQQYAEARVCRRKILMAYFGEDLSKDCGNCDVCKNPPEVEDATILVQKALSALKRLQEKVGIGALIDVLRGSQKSYIFQNGYHRIKTFGAGKALSYRDWQHYILQMLHHGLIEIAYDQKHTLRVTNAGKDVLFNDRHVDLVKPLIDESGSQTFLKPEPQKTKKQEFEEQLFNELRMLRKEIADSKGVPPYVVFSDATLREMASNHPMDLGEMASVSGVGEFKLAEYGEAFLNQIRHYIAASDIGSSAVKGKTYIQTLQLVREGRSVSEIAQERNIHVATVYAHLVCLFEKKLITTIENYLTPGEMGKIEAAVRATGVVDKLKPLYEHLKEQIEYGKIRLYLSYRNQSK
ncbi:MAG: DNA helicase RecQ [Cytophagales bacterium]|nr:DNA helicase RecQ [Cytophagales bacterium]